MLIVGEWRNKGAYSAKSESWRRDHRSCAQWSGAQRRTKRCEYVGGAVFGNGEETMPV